tara:strand:- start:5735 stop:5968 length:234 start_codon:yes stop_codon:yes gene_type:complete
MKNRKVRREDLKTDPNNENKTIPPSPGLSGSKQYHEGNYPVRERELVRDYGSATLIEWTYPEEMDTPKLFFEHRRTA